MTTATQTLPQLVRQVEQRAEHLQPVDRGDRLDRYQVNFMDGHEPVMARFAQEGQAQQAYHMARRAMTQMLQRLDMPTRFFDRLPAGLQFANVNWLIQNHAYDKECLIRTVRGNRTRAILSGAYTPIDDIDMVPMVADVLTEFGDCQIVKTDFTDDYTHIRVVFPRREVELRKGDIVRQGFNFTNSEVGLRAYVIEPFVERLVCLNGLVVPEGFGRTTIRHVGKSERIKDAIHNALRDSLTGVEDLTKAFKESLEHRITAPIDFIEAHAKQADLSKEQLNRVLESFATGPGAGGDPTLFGIVNAFTHAAQGEETMEKRYQMERAGGALLLPNGAKALKADDSKIILN